MKSQIAALLTVCLVSANSVADNCTGQVEGHLRGLETAYPNHPQIAKIEGLRERMSDCEVRAQIPQFQINDTALEHATKVVEQMKERQ